MPKFYEPLNDNHKLREVLNQVIGAYHHILLDSGVTIAPNRSQFRRKRRAS